ncbi:AAA family ATPase [Halobaculum sp. MBLA0147]|uniref:AAA family ATPase n=1 Tax=Halobaculum sp. MBLA0147 TaxID=3079934 RepID=UPI00352361F0
MTDGPDASDTGDASVTPVLDGGSALSGDAPTATLVDDSLTSVTSAAATTASLVVVCGPPGVGKTTVAETAAERLDATLLRTDVVRKDLFPAPTYSDEETTRVYTELLERARSRLAREESVVLDGTFRTRDTRRRAAGVAETTDTPARLVRVACEEPVVRRRLADREDDASDADFAVHRSIREQFEPLELAHARIDNSGTAAATRRQVEERL